MAFASPELDAIILGGAGTIPTTSLWTEIRSLLQNAYGMIAGQVTLAGPSGATVTFTDLGVVDYEVFYWVEYNSGVQAGSTGEIRIEIISATSFKIYNSGSDVASVVKYRIFKR